MIEREDFEEYVLRESDMDVTDIKSGGRYEKMYKRVLFL